MQGSINKAPHQRPPCIILMCSCFITGRGQTAWVREWAYRPGQARLTTWLFVVAGWRQRSYQQARYLSTPYTLPYDLGTELGALTNINLLRCQGCQAWPPWPSQAASTQQGRDDAQGSRKTPLGQNAVHLELARSHPAVVAALLPGLEGQFYFFEEDNDNVMHTQGHPQED
jgi:hypothetical protein